VSEGNAVFRVVQQQMIQDARIQTLESVEYTFDTRTTAAYLQLPVLRAFWPMSSYAYTNPEALDISANGNHLGNTNTVTFGYDSLAPIARFVAASTQYLSRADGGAGNWADIIGNETDVISTQRGLTMMGWFSPTLATSGLMTKGTAAAAASSYELFIQAPTSAIFRVSTGAAYIAATLTGLTATTWNFIAGRYIPSTEVRVWIGGATAVTVAAVPATLPDTATQFSIGAFAAGTLPYDGDASMCALCACALSDATIRSVYNQTRQLFQV
jgi:hypothetical protein